MPIAYIQRTQERYAAFAPYKWAINAEAPWTPLAKPIRDCRLAVITSGGFYLPGQEPFVDNDTSFRVIPKDVDLRELKIHHHGYRDADADRDPNCVFPMDRLRELEATGVIGELAGALSFVMVYSHRREIQERAPKMIAALKAMGAEAALCVPV